METQAVNTRERIKKTYLEYVLTQGRQPASPYLIAQHLGIPESDFYSEFNSVEAIEADLWLGFFEEARQKTEGQEVYEGYSVREKLLSFYFTWVEVLKRNRSFVLFATRGVRSGDSSANAQLRLFRPAFKEFVGELLREGRSSGEVANRPLVMDRYADGFYMQALFVLNFFVKDQSKGFEQTDAAIEKAVNTSLDLVGPSAVDSVLDFAKFLYQTRN
jgi:AcrR family transcriptional regulator